MRVSGWIAPSKRSWVSLAVVRTSFDCDVSSVATSREVVQALSRVYVHLRYLLHSCVGNTVICCRLQIVLRFNEVCLIYYMVFTQCAFSYCNYALYRLRVQNFNIIELTNCCVHVGAFNGIYTFHLHIVHIIKSLLTSSQSTAFSCHCFSCVAILYHSNGCLFTSLRTHTLI